jgi:hypothetical protein
MTRTLLVLLVCLAAFGCGQKEASEPAHPPPAVKTPSESNDKIEDVRFVGTWQLEITDDLKQAAKKLKQPPPEVALEAHEDGTFDLWGRTANGEFEVSGEYFVQGNRVTLRAKEVDGQPPLLSSEDEPRAGTVSADGRTFTDESGSIWKKVKD